MKKIVKKYQISKFRCFLNGLTFAMITVIALVLCLININGHTEVKGEVLLPFVIAIISMLMGFITMFRSNGLLKGKVKYAK